MGFQHVDLLILHFLGSGQAIRISHPKDPCQALKGWVVIWKANPRQGCGAEGRGRGCSTCGALG